MIFGRIGKVSPQVFESRFGISVKNYLFAGRPAPGFYFSVKWTFIGLTSVKKVLMTMPAFSNTFPVCRLSQKPVPWTDFSEFVLFFGDRFSMFCRKTKNTCFLTKKKTPQADPSDLFFWFYYFYFLFLMPRPIFARQKWPAGGGNPGKKEGS